MKLYPIKPSRRETLWGGIYLILYLWVLPWLVPLFAGLFFPHWNAAQVNFLFFCLNFAATTVIFRRFLLTSLKAGLMDPMRTFWGGALGYMGGQALGNILIIFILRLYPGFANVNNANIAGLVQLNAGLMVLGVVFLVPVAEELLFRGLIFRGLYDKNPLAAHLVTMVLFSFIHVSGYIGAYEPKLLLLCFVQYLPMSYCLNFAYLYTGTLAGPIVMHMLTNLMALLVVR